MNKTRLEEGLWVYSFLPTFKNEFVSYNLVVLEDNDRVLLIDTAFKRHFNPLMEELKTRNKEITHVITTHHHKDHIGGLIKLYGKETYASSDCEITLKKVFKEHEYYKYLPKYYVEETTKITFGRFQLELIKNPGHSVDGLHVVINDKYIIPGDDILFTEKQVPLLPFDSDHNIENHIKALQVLKSYMNESILIPSHGNITVDDATMKQDVDNRIAFLKEKQKNPHITSEEFYEKTGIYFLGYPWYRGNV